MTRLIAALFAALLLALGFTAAGTPASAEDKAPWYMPPAWVHPPLNGPKVRPQAGYYGYTQRNAYGSFSTGCYGSCGNRQGVVSTGYGVVLSRPVVAIYDGYQYQLMSRDEMAAWTNQVLEQAASTAYQPQQKQLGGGVVPARVAQRANLNPKARFQMQNGVRIIRPATNY